MKVYIVEYGEYSDRYISCVFATRELAEEYVIETARRQHGSDIVERLPDMSFDQWQKANERWYRDSADITEFDVWDAVPIADLVK